MKLLTAALSFMMCVTSLYASPGISLANDYQKNSGLQWQWAMDSLKKFPFNETDKVLDVGCGDGKITALIAQQVPQGMVVGLDISSKMLSHATESFPPQQPAVHRGER